VPLPRVIIGGRLGTGSAIVYAYKGQKRGTPMAAYIVWSKYYSVNASWLDAEHRQVIDLINRLYDAIQRDAEGHATKEVLERLIEYTHTHFQHEEEAMQEAGYPDIQVQKALHDQMRQKTLDLRTNLSLVAGRDVLRFLKDWWVNHIQGEDRKYAPYMAHAAGRETVAAADARALGSQ
jgi:hemerythrin